MSNFILSTAEDGSEWFINIDTLCDASFYKREDGCNIVRLTFVDGNDATINLDKEDQRIQDFSKQLKVLLRNRANQPLVKCIKNEGYEQYFTVGEYYEISYDSGDQYAFYGIDSEYQVFGPKEYFV